MLDKMPNTAQILIVFATLFISACGEAMNDFDRKKEYEQCLPDKLHIDEIGWSDFLNQWNDEVLFWVKKATLKFGADPWFELNHWKKHLKDLGLPDIYIELVTKGVDYPPRTESDKKVTEERFIVTGR